MSTLRDMTRRIQDNDALEIAKHALEEVTALKHCLSIAGLLCHDRFAATLHRIHFNAELQAHPLQSDSQRCLHRLALMEVLSVDAFASRVFSFLPSREVRTLSFLSHSIHGLVQQMIGPITTKCLYLCSSSEKAGVVCFDPKSGCWSSVPASLTNHEDVTWCECEGRLYACGGLSASHGEALELTTSVECYDPSVGCWEVLPPMSYGRQAAACCSLAGCLYICGGSGLRNESDVDDEDIFFNLEEWFALASAERFDPMLCQWEVLPPMHTRRSEIKTCSSTVSRSVYAYGSSRMISHSASADCYALDRGQWEALPTLLENRMSAMSCALGGGLFICGGFVIGPSGDAYATRSTELWCPDHKRWVLMAAMPEGRVGGVCCSSSDSIFVCGGRRLLKPSPSVNSVACYKPSLDCWETLQVFPSIPQLFVMSACHMHGNVYVLSRGVSEGDESVHLTRSIDTRMGLWENLPPVPDERCFHGSVNTLVTVTSCQG